MEGLFSRLFTYRPRPGRSPLEDFVTEVWVDLLNRIPSSQQLDFCSRVLMANMGDDLRRSWRDLVEECGSEEFSWQTQYSVQINKDGGVSTKRPDIVLSCGGKPALIVENKIGAGFTYHEQVGEGDEIETVNQLQIYGEWLAKKTDGKGALVLLTAWTAPPIGFEKIGGKYGVAARSVVRWNEVYKQLSKDGLSYWSDSEPAATVLIEEFIKFLEVQELVQQNPTSDDVDKAEAFFGEPYKKLYDAVGYVGAQIIPQLKENGGTRPVGPNMFYTGLWLEQYMNFDKQPWISWGIRKKVAENKNQNEHATPNKLYAYVSLGLGIDCWNIILQSDGSAEWNRLEAGQSESSVLIREIPVMELMAKDQEFSWAFWQWCDPDNQAGPRVLKEALDIRQEIVKHLNS